MKDHTEEGYTCDGSIKGIKGIEKPKNCMECWFSDWIGQETHEPKFPGWCPVVWRDEDV